jgi:hypothetical protein
MVDGDFLSATWQSPTGDTEIAGSTRGGRHITVMVNGQRFCRSPVRT